MVILLEEFPFGPGPATFDESSIVKTKVVSLGSVRMSLPETGIYGWTVRVDMHINRYLLSDEFLNGFGLHSFNHPESKSPKWRTGNAWHTNLGLEVVRFETMVEVGAFPVWSKVRLINLNRLPWLKYRAFHYMETKQSEETTDRWHRELR
jgi:hypothetical protein